MMHWRSCTMDCVGSSLVHKMRVDWRAPLIQIFKNETSHEVNSNDFAQTQKSVLSKGPPGRCGHFEDAPIDMEIAISLIYLES
jgi:hypothetical protein